MPLIHRLRRRLLLRRMQRRLQEVRAKQALILAFYEVMMQDMEIHRMICRDLTHHRESEQE